MREIPKIDGGTCATCAWGDKKGSGVCVKPKEIHTPGIEWDDFHNSRFYGYWCRNWQPNPIYVSPPKDADLILPAFTVGLGKYAEPSIQVFCPDCGEFILIGQGRSGRYEHTHTDHHRDGGEYFADVLGPMTPFAKSLKRVALAHSADTNFWQNPFGPNTQEYRFTTPDEADKHCSSFFLGNWFGGPTATTVREILRYLRLGDDYPFKCDYARASNGGWTPGAGGRIVYRDRSDPAGNV